MNLNSEVIVLCYHRFEDKPKDSLAIKPADFEVQMQALKDNGVTVIPMADFLAWRRGEKSIPAKSAVVSIDDGYISGYSVAWPVLKKFGYPFTMFIYTDYVKGGPKSGGQSITWEQLGEMRDAGVDIQSHTVSHSSLNAKKGKLMNNTTLGLGRSRFEGASRAKAAFARPSPTPTVCNDAVRCRQGGRIRAAPRYMASASGSADPTIIGRYAIDPPNRGLRGGGGLQGSVEGGGRAMPASVTMVTQPWTETVSDSSPEIVPTTTLGNVEPKSVTMRISGWGWFPLPMIRRQSSFAKVTQKLYEGQVTVIVSATVNGRKPRRGIFQRWFQGG